MYRVISNPWWLLLPSRSSADWFTPISPNTLARQTAGWPGRLFAGVLSYQWCKHVWDIYTLVFSGPLTLCTVLNDKKRIDSHRWPLMTMHFHDSLEEVVGNFRAWENDSHTPALTCSDATKSQWFSSICSVASWLTVLPWSNPLASCNLCVYVCVCLYACVCVFV